VSGSRRETPIGPAPHGASLSVTIACTATPADRVGVAHSVGIRPDWTVDTPHDLDAERTARAFGAWCSCLFFAEVVVPMLRRTLLGAADSALVGDAWRPWWRAERAADAARLAFSVDGLAALCRTSAWSLDGLEVAARAQAAAILNAACWAWARAGDPRQVRDGVDGFALLWDSGVLPMQVDAIARRMLHSTWPLSVEFYEAAFFGAVPAVWLAGVTTSFPTSAFAEWAAAQEHRWESISPDDVERLRELHLSDADAIGALEERISPAAITEAALLAGVSARTASRFLIAWSRVGVAPTRDQVALLARRGAVVEHPPVRRLDDVVAALRPVVLYALPRTEIAVMLAICPDIAVLTRAARLGVRAATDPRFTRMVDERTTTP
jgi:hypothetical protein